MIILACAPLLIAAVMAAGFATWHFLFTDGGRHATPRPPVIAERLAGLPVIRAFRS